MLNSRANMEPMSDIIDGIKGSFCKPFSGMDK